MSHILLLNSSADLQTSQSRAATAKIVADLAPDTVTTRDLALSDLPKITGAWADARMVPAEDRTAEQNDILALSDTLVAEIQAADTLVFGVPIYNFSIPASLKLWIDLVARPKVTFEYTAEGPRGLMLDKKAVLVAASGGVPIESPADFATPYMRFFLGFIGITDVTVALAKEINDAS